MTTNEVTTRKRDRTMNTAELTCTCLLDDEGRSMVNPGCPDHSPLVSEVLTLSDPALVAFVDFIRLNSPQLTRDPTIIRRVFAAYVVSDLAAPAPVPGGVGL